MARVYLLRHGDYDYSDQREEVVGQGLTARGRQQAIAAAAWLAERLKPGFILISSDFARARQTADLIAEAVSWNQRYTESILRECRDVYFANLDATDPRPAQALSRLSELARSHEVIAVCHANLIRNFLARTGSWSVRRWQTRIIPLCSLSILYVEDGEAPSKVEAVAKLNHVPKALRDPY